MRRRGFALCVVVPLVASCSGSTVETTAPSTIDRRTPSSMPAPSTAAVTTTSIRRLPTESPSTMPVETATTAPIGPSTVPTAPLPSRPSVPETTVDPAALVPTTNGLGGAIAFIRASQLWLLDAGGGTRLLDDGPVGAVRAGPGASVFFERLVDRSGEKRHEIWRVDVDTGVKSLVLPVPADEFDFINLELIAKVDGRDRLAYSRWEWPLEVGKTLNSVKQVMYLTSLDATETPTRVTVIGGNEWGVDVSAFAGGMFVGTRGDIQQSAPAAFGSRGEPPTPAMLAALRCQHVCDGSYGSSCSFPHALGCGFRFTISPDGTRLAWMESSRVEQSQFAPEVVGHDLVVVDVATGAELQRNWIPAMTKSSSAETISWLAADRLLLSIGRFDTQSPSPLPNVNFIAQLTAHGADFSRLLLPEANDTRPVPLLGM